MTLVRIGMAYVGSLSDMLASHKKDSEQREESGWADMSRMVMNMHMYIGIGIKPDSIWIGWQLFLRIKELSSTSSDLAFSWLPARRSE